MDRNVCHKFRVYLGIQAGANKLSRGEMAAPAAVAASALFLCLPPSLPLCRQHTEKLTIVGSNHTLVLNAERVAHREPLMYSTIWGQPPHPLPPLVASFDVLPLLPLATVKCIHAVSHESND